MTADRLSRDNERHSLLMILGRVDAAEGPEQAERVLRLLGEGLPILQVCATHRMANAAERQADAAEATARELALIRECLVAEFGPGGAG